MVARRTTTGRARLRIESPKYFVRWRLTKQPWQVKGARTSPPLCRSRPIRLGLTEREPALGIEVHCHPVPFAEVSLEQPHGQLVLQPLLDDPLERPRAVHRIVTLLSESLAGRVGEFQCHLAILEHMTQPSQLDLDDLSNLFTGEGAEDDHFIDAVEKLGPQVATKLLHHPRPEFLNRV